MYRLILLFFAYILSFSMQAQRVLHFTKTSGFDHNTRDVSFAMFTAIGDELDVQVDDDSDGSTFNELDTLLNYSVIIFSNTSGDAILDGTQRSNFEQWVAQGGRVLGIHAATDTYRHSTANGGNTGAWDFYAELIGGSVQADPNHVAGTPSYELSHLEPHASNANLPDPWQKEEEYYYWQNGYLHPLIIPVLEVEQTVGPNGQVNSYDVHRPMSWFRITSTGRIFYTALGHATSNYTDDTLFRTHVKDALAWLLEDITGLEEGGVPPVTVRFDHDLSRLLIDTGMGSIGAAVKVLDNNGRIIRGGTINGPITSIDLSGIAAGIYLVQLEGRVTQKVAVW